LRIVSTLLKIGNRGYIVVRDGCKRGRNMIQSRIVLNFFNTKFKADAKNMLMGTRKSTRRIHRHRRGDISREAGESGSRKGPGGKFAGRQGSNIHPKKSPEREKN